ncbi:MAG: hypothetical protein ACK4ME_08620 [Fimbriimonadales bacterium]
MAILGVNSALAQAFTYQGFLRQGGNPLNNPTQAITFRIYDAPTGGALLWNSGALTVNVQNGLFTVSLNAPASIWTGADRYLEIQVGSTTLSPRVKINPTPYAIRATTAGTANPIGAAGGDLSGAYPNPTVARLQGRAVANTTPSNGEVLKWNGSAWTPAADLRDQFWQASGSNIYYNSGNVGVGVTSPAYPLTVQTNSHVTAVYGHHTATTGINFGGWFRSAGPGGAGVLGIHDATTGYSYGVQGESQSVLGRGVVGVARGPGATDGGYSQAPVGVLGEASTDTGVAFGGVFAVLSPQAHGVQVYRRTNTSPPRYPQETRLVTRYDARIDNSVGLPAGGYARSHIGFYGYSSLMLEDGSAISIGTGIMGESDWKGVGGWTRDGYGVAGHQMGEFSSGVGVWGFAESATGIAVKAYNEQNGPALAIRGQILVEDAHQSSQTPVFKHVTASANTSGNITTINHPMCNGDPNAMLFVTHDYGSSGPYVAKPFGVWYNSSAGRWTIFIEDLSAMPIGARFNVLVVKTTVPSMLRGGSPPIAPSATRPGYEQ